MEIYAKLDKEECKGVCARISPQCKQAKWGNMLEYRRYYYLCRDKIFYETKTETLQLLAVDQRKLSSGTRCESWNDLNNCSEYSFFPCIL